MDGEGVKKFVYGLKKVSPTAVETEGGKLIRKPGPPSPSDCRGCSLIDFICEELDYPCPGIYNECRKSGGGLNCEDCEKIVECLDNRPCCWQCECLPECLETAREGGEDFVKQRFKCDWEEFVEAVKMLLEK